MFDIINKYQASIFGNFEDIQPSLQGIQKIQNIFTDNEYLPTIFRELTPNSILQPRLMLCSPNNEHIIRFATNRIDVEKNVTDLNGSNMGEINTFALQTIKYFDNILTNFNRKAHRLSLITSGMLKEMKNDETNKIFTTLFNINDFYRKNPPFEWASRYVSKKDITINNIVESINAITCINRVNGQIMLDNTSKPYDRIEISFDINTAHANQETRFDKPCFETFYTEAINLRNIILNELNNILHETK